MKIKDIIVESSNMASAEQIWDYVGGIHPKDQQGGGFLKRLIMRNPQYELKRVPLSSLHVPNDEDDGNDPYGRAMFVDVDHAREYSQHHVDKKPVVADAEGHILDGAHRAWAAAELLNRTDIMAWVPAEKLTESQSVKQEIKDFIDSLTPADVGVEEFPGYRVHFEGFTDDCKLSSDYQRNPNKVYQQVYQDFVQREGGKKPAKSGMTGDEEYPILYSVFRVPQSKTVDTAERAYSIAYRKKQPWPRGSREEQLIRSDWQLSGLYDQYVLKQGVAESSLNEAPAGGYRLVRVVDGLDNIQANGDGSLTAIARYNGHSQRNTLHFTVNSMVGDHNMGKFPGKYVIIANPAEMPRDQAAGARAEDTWYRFNNEGEINLGRAIVLAPEGSSVPNGIKAEYYKGDRSTAIDTAFKQMNVGFHGVAGTDAVIGIKNDEYHKDFSTQYGTGATQGGQHDGSLEGYLESIPARLQGYLGHLQKSIHYAPPGERETFVTSYANEIISIYRDQITKWAKANPQEFRVSATYFNYIIQIMDAYQAIFTRAEQAYNQQYQDYRAAEKQWKASNRPPAPGQPPPLDPAPPPKMATWPPQGLDLSVPNIQLSYAKKNLQGVAEGVYRGDWVRHPDNPWQIGQIQSIDNGQAVVTWKKIDKRKKAVSSMHPVDDLQHARREFSQLTQPTHGVAEDSDLQEIATMPADQFAGGKDMLDYMPPPSKKRLKPLPGGTDLMYAIETMGPETRVQIVDPGVPGITRPVVVAVLNLDPSSMPNTVQVGSITVDEDYRGRGLAKSLYGIVLTIMQKNLVSGSSQTPGGRRNWLSLATIPGVEVQGLVRIPNQIFDLERSATVSPQWRKYADRTIDQVMELGGQFYSKDGNSTYWLFDVVPGKGSLQPAVKNALSRLYGYDSDNLLLATWSGA